MLVDKYGRPLTTLRISITNKCNYNCVFCHREGEENTPDALTADDIELVSRAAYSLAVKNFKLTGGEPLIRPDVAEIVSRLKEIGKDVEVSMTSNGFFLEEYAEKLAEADLDRINVSFHGISTEKYLKMTNVNGKDKVLRGLLAIKEYGIPVKLNYVLTSLNADELTSILDFASSMGFNVNVIELIPTGRGRQVFDRLYLPVEKILPILTEKATRIERRDLHNRPVFVLPSGIKVEVIANYCNPSFCMECTRIRLTHDAKLKPCLNTNDNNVDIYKILKNPTLKEQEKIEKLKDAIRETNLKREPFFKLVNGKCIMRDIVLGTPRTI